MTEISLDAELVDQVIAATGLHSAAGAVEFALREFVDRRAQRQLISFFGSMVWDESYDYKLARN